MHKRLFLIPLILLVTLPSCSARKANASKAYLNFKYVLMRAGDLHGLPPTSNEVLSRNEGFTSYIELFDKNKSYINFQCKGTSYEDFYCESSFYLYDKDGNLLVHVESFNCSYSGGQGGTVVYSDNETEEYLGTIYVSTPYWCRWQYDYDVDGSGNKVLLTFEFWKSQFNQLPTFFSE